MPEAFAKLRGGKALAAPAKARRAVACLLASAAVGLWPASHVDAAPASTPGGQPNIIFILADDLGYGDLGCYGQKNIKTPNLDRMAAEGLRFTDAYAGGTVCAPSRCVLMTGQHIGHTRIRGLREATLPGAALEAEDVTVARVLKDAGYSTGHIGKWGLGETSKNKQGLPWRHGFDFFYGYLKHGHAHNYYPDFLWRNNTQEKLPNVLATDPKLNQRVAAEKKQYSHDLLAEESLKFVREHKDGPFFLFLAYTIPHANNEAGNEGMEVPDYGDYAEKDWPTPEKGKAAMISRMDADIGRLFALLKELKIDDNTLVVFSSDNGPPANEGGRLPEFNDSNGPLRGFKGNLTEGGIRVPFIVRWPGRVKPDTTSDAPITFADIMPTFAALAGGHAPSGLDGADIVPTLEGHEQPELADRMLYWEFGKVGVAEQAARWRHWKTIRDPKTNTLQLYDLSKDLGESQDIAADHPDLVNKFRAFYRTARSDSRLWPMSPRGAGGGKRGAEAGG